MGTSREWLRRMMSLGRRDQIESGVDEEIEFHIERQTEKNLRQGMSLAEARLSALVKFGGVERAKEGIRDEVRPLLLEDFWRDVRYGVRTLLRAPGFSLVAILTLGLGIGAATAVYSVVHGVLLQPLPYPNEDRLVRLFQIDQDGNRMGQASEPNFNDWKSRSRSFASMAEVQARGSVTITGNFEPHRAPVVFVSREFLDVMGVGPSLGRAFAHEDQRIGAAPVALVSDAYWRRWLGGETNLSGHTLSFGNATVQVIGVMPASFNYPAGTDVWVPRELNEPQIHRTGHNFVVIGRLKDDIAVETARGELSSISRALKTQYGDDTWMSDATVIQLREQMTSASKPLLLLLFGASGFLLLIACANVSNLLLARAASRQRELAVRLAIGAGRWRVTRQLLAESLVLCLTGSAVGLVVAYYGVHGLLALEPGNLPRVGEVQVSASALAFALGIAMLTAIVLGLATTIRGVQGDLRDYLAEGTRTMAGGRGSQRVRDALVVAQVALTLVLLSGAGLLTRSFMRVLQVDPGFSTDDALLLDLNLPEWRGEGADHRRVQFQDALLERLRALPGVSQVALINDFPLGGWWYANGTFIEMSSPTEVQSFEDLRKLDPAEVKERTGMSGFRVASADYFRTMGIPLIRGRFFEAGDGPDAPHVALISESLAKAKWPNREPIGRFIQYGNMDGDLRAFRIVGIVGDVREFGPEGIVGPLFYGNSRQRTAAAQQFSVIVRGPPPASIAGTAQGIVRQLNPELPVRVRTVQEALDASLAGRRFSLILIGVFSIAALVLATLGIYGVISYLVAQRTRELGIRLALGADSAQIVRLIVGKGALLALYGTILGIAVALALTRLMSRLLFGVSATDPLSFASVVAVIGAAVLGASYVPARRAIRAATVSTLRIL